LESTIELIFNYSTSEIFIEKQKVVYWRIASLRLWLAMPRGMILSDDRLSIFNNLPTEHLPPGPPGFKVPEDDLESLHHSCDFCQRHIVFDFTEDPTTPLALSKTEFFIIYDFLDDDDWKTFMGRLDVEETKEDLLDLLRDTYFFDLGLEELEDGAGMGCRFCDKLLESVDKKIKDGNITHSFIIGATIESWSGEEILFRAFDRRSFISSEFRSWQSVSLGGFGLFAPVGKCASSLCIFDPLYWRFY
jgi:hypothetical protein